MKTPGGGEFQVNAKESIMKTAGGVKTCIYLKYKGNPNANRRRRQLLMYQWKYKGNPN